MSDTRLLFVAHGMVPQRIRFLGELQRRYRCTIHVVTRVDDAEFREQQIETTVLSSCNVNLSLLDANLPELPLSLRPLVAVHRFRPEAVIASGFGSAPTAIAAALARLRGVPFIIWNENVLFSESTKSWVVWALKRALVRQASAHWAVGTLAKRHLHELGASQRNLHIVPYVIDAEYFSRAAEAARSGRDELRASLGVRPEDWLLIQVCRLEKGKGLLHSLTALRALNRRNRTLLLVLGEGSLRPVLESESRRAGLLDRLLLVGEKPNADLPRFLVAGDLFILPSEWEVWGLVVNEAAAAGLPMVLSERVGAGYDLLQQGENGSVVPESDPLRLASACLDILGDAARRRVMGDRSRNLGTLWNYDLAFGNVATSLSQLNLSMVPRE